MNLAWDRRDNSCKEAFAGHWILIFFGGILQRCHLSDADFSQCSHFHRLPIPAKKIVEL